MPPPSKAASDPSMGYNIYDSFDLGEFDQKGAIKTWFGLKQELIDLINAAHEFNLNMYVDIVINHNSGGMRRKKTQLMKKCILEPAENGGRGFCLKAQSSTGIGSVCTHHRTKDTMIVNMAIYLIYVTVTHMSLTTCSNK